MKPAKHQFTILKQICHLIPAYLVPKLARKHGVDLKARSFSPWSHVVALLHTQLSHALSLNDVCDTLRNHEAQLGTVRKATPPSRNGFSHANRTRNADMAEDLFWSVLSHIQKTHPKFGIGHRYSGLPRRFKRTIYAMDSTTIQLVMNCLSWAKHRRRKAAAKCHLQLNLQTFLPTVALVKAANSHDSTEAKELCANLRDGEIVVFDKAYIDFPHLHTLDKRGVFWVTRSKSNIRYSLVNQRPVQGPILSDSIIEFEIEKSKEAYPKKLRLVEAEVDQDGETKKMSFLTNNLDWAPSSICDLYRSRWGVEVFFKQIKQTLQLADFLGHNENAVRWQIWTALLVYLLLRFLSYISEWRGPFSRLFTIVRGVLFQRLDLIKLINFCGTARGDIRMVSRPCQSFLPGFEGFG
jgi:hypothetical protein